MIFRGGLLQAGGTNSGYWFFAAQSNAAPGHDLSDVSGNNANYNHAGAADGPYYTTVVGQYINSPSAYGTFDQYGNVRQWNETAENDTFGMFRGADGIGYGGYAQDSSGRPLTNGAPVAVSQSSVGFRVAQIPEPASIGVVALALIAGSRIARRRSTLFDAGL